MSWILPMLMHHRLQAPGAGLRLGEYVLHQLLARGARTQVWEALPCAGGAAVVIKLQRRAGARSLRSLLREWQVLRSLSHPAVVRLLAAGRAPGLLWLVLQRVVGQPVTLYAQQRQLPLVARLGLLLQLLEVLQYLEQQQLVHGDLKPPHVLVGADGQLVLLDFGSATRLSEHAPAVAGPVPFTPSYAAPERLRGGAPDASGDVYAVGVLLYQLLSGLRPVPHCPESLDPAQLVPGWRAPSLRNEDLPPGCVISAAALQRLDAIVQRCLEPLPQQRWSGPASLAGAVREFLSAASPSAAR